MNINWILSLLVHKKLITEDEAEHLSKKLAFTVYPQNFKDAHKIIKSLLDEVESKQKKRLHL